MIKINLLPPELRRKKKAPIIDKILIYVVLVLVAEGILLYGVSMKQRATINDLEDQIVVVQGEIRKYDRQIKLAEQAKALRDKMNQRMNAIQLLETQRPLWVKTLEELTVVLPDNLWYRKLSYDKERITLSGTSYSIRSIAMFIINLLNSKYFDKIGLQVIEKVGGAGGVTAYNYNLSMNLILSSAKESAGEFKIKEAETKKGAPAVKKGIDLAAKGKEALGVNKEEARKAMEGLAP